MKEQDWTDSEACKRGCERWCRAENTSSTILENL